MLMRRLRAFASAGQAAAGAADQNLRVFNSVTLVAAVDDRRLGGWSVRMATCSSVSHRVWPS